MTLEATKQTEENADYLDIYTTLYAHAQDFFEISHQYHYNAEELALEVV